MHDKVKEFFLDANGFFEATVGAIVKSDLVFFLAMLGILQWHVRYAFADHRYVQMVNNCLGRPGLVCRRLSLDIWILQFYYDPDMPLKTYVANRIFVSTVGLIAFDAVVLGYGFRLLAKALRCLRKTSCCSPLAPPVSNYEEALDACDNPCADNDDPDGNASDPADSIYMDVSQPFLHALTMCICQLSLVALFIDDLNSDSDTHDVSKVKYGFWFIAIMLQLFAADSQLGNSTNFRWWGHLLGWDEPPKEVQGGGEMEKMHVDVVKQRRADLETIRGLTHSRLGLPTTYKLVWRMRFLCDWAVNGMAKQLVLCIFPIMLCVEEPLDFVKDCTALFFMTMLDDLSPARTWNQLMVVLKFKVAYDELNHERAASKWCPKSNRGKLNKPEGTPIPFTEHEKHVIEEELEKSVKLARQDRFDTQREYLVEDWSTGSMEKVPFLSLIMQDKWPMCQPPEGYACAP